jgi:predicted TIM-barrel fold metal-dependent hydrolase
MTNIVDFHTHAFPDKVARNAIPLLEEEGDVKAKLDGTLRALLGSMDASGIASSVICSIATKPEQFAPILAWSQEIRSPRILPFPSVHPADPDFREHLRRIKGEGFAGIKMHPYYQSFFLDEERMLPFYQAVAAEKLILVMHTGFDIAFPRDRRANPKEIIFVLERFPDLLLVTTHMGSWQVWDEVEEHLLGKPIYMDISFSLDYMESERARRMIAAHPPGYVLFGSDSPWDDQQKCLSQLRTLGLAPELLTGIMGGNAARLIAKTAT